MQDDRPVIGHIRFSFYGSSDTILRPDDSGEALSKLYDETRMARRFYLFERLTLPSLLAQTDQNFFLIVMSSDVMPERYKDRLRQIMRCFPDAILDFSESRRSEEAFADYMSAALGANPKGSAVHFRLDDDDALASSYIQRLRRVSLALRPETCISFPTGILLFPTKRNRPEGRSMITKSYLAAMGLAIISNRYHRKNPFMMAHQMVWQERPVFSDPKFVAYIRTMHFDNDTVERQDKVLRVKRADREGVDSAAHERAVEGALERGFPFIDRLRLDSLIAEVHAIRSMADVPSVDSLPYLGGK
jgi:hypothetical protein